MKRWRDRIVTAPDGVPRVAGTDLTVESGARFEDRTMDESVAARPGLTREGVLAAMARDKDDEP